MGRGMRSARSIGLISICLLGLAAMPALAGLQTASVEMAACAGSSPGVLRDNADLIVTGTVTDVAVSARSSTAEIGVDQAYKGAASGEMLSIMTASGSQQRSSVDVPFQEGSRYLLYLREEGGEYTTDICSGTQPVGDFVPPEIVASLVEETPSNASPALPETGGAIVPVLAAGLQTASGDLASCGGGGVDVDLVVTGTVEDVTSSRASSRVEVLAERVLLGDESYAGKTLTIQTDSGTNSGVSEEVGFREGGRYELHLRDDGDYWKTNLCLGSRELAESPTGSPDIPETGGPSLPPFVALGGLFLAGIGAALWLGMRRLG